MLGLHSVYYCICEHTYMSAGAAKDSNLSKMGTVQVAELGWRCVCCCR